jgi:O-antigen/teichoic acid export membrane protein
MHGPITDDAGDLTTDVAHALRDALKLGASLLGTWTVAMIVRIILPRYLGPAAFGTFQFADSFTDAVMVITTLGIDTYIRREIPTRPQHVADFFAGTLVLRVLLGALVLGGAYVAIAMGGKSPEVRHMVVILGAAQLLMVINTTYGAVLQSARTVGVLSLLNVGSKLVWGAGIGIVLAVGGGVIGVAAAMLASEVLRTIALTIITYRTVQLRWQISVRASSAVLVASVPFFLTTLAQTVYSRIDVSVMSFLTNDIEVGWYGAASNIARLSFLLAPLITWVLLPLTSRAAARSDAELTAVAQRSMDWILMVTFPISLLMGVGADVLVSVAFGRAYAAAAMSLRTLAPTFVLTYVGTVSGSLLVRLGRSWVLMVISLGGMALAGGLNILLIPWAERTIGTGGAGVGAGVTLVITEFTTAATMTWLLGRRVFNRESALRAAKCCLICGAIVAVHRALAPIHTWRILVDGVLYFALAIAWRAIDMEALISVMPARMPAWIPKIGLARPARGDTSGEQRARSR